MMEETRILLRNVGNMDPVSVEDFRANGGFQGLENALSMPAQEVIDVIIASGLLGRGGAGFPWGLNGVPSAICWQSRNLLFAMLTKGNLLPIRSHFNEWGPAEPDRKYGYCRLRCRCQSRIHLSASGVSLSISRVVPSHGKCASGRILGKNILGSGVDFEIALSPAAELMSAGKKRR